MKTSVKVLIIIAAVVLAGTILLIPHAISPNTPVEEIESPEITHEDVVQPLVNVSYENNSIDASATITFPDGSSFKITADEAGFLTDTDGAIAAVGLSDAINTEFNKEYVREVVTTYTGRFNDTLVDEAYNILRDSIIITKGSYIEPADVDEVFALTVETLYWAIEERAHLTADVTSNMSSLKELDLTTLFERVFIEPVSAFYDSQTHAVAEEVMGVSFDMTGAQIMMDQAEAGTKVVIPLIFTMPEVTSRQLGRLLFRDILAERTTIISGTNNRLNNVQLSTATVNGTILAPGEEFSFNRIVGQRTAERGYLEAGAYVNNETIMETGGGICQTSSTIYDCVLHADLAVIERWNHMFTVGYLPLGNDATINWGTADLKFINNTEYPIRIEAIAVGRSLTVKLIGTKLDDNYIKIDYKLISSTPYSTIRQEDESVPQGTTVNKSDGHTGYVVDTYKYLYDKDDNLISETLVDRSVYVVQNRVILIPPESEQEDASDENDESPPSDIESTSPPETPPDVPDGNAHDNAPDGYTSDSEAPGRNAPPDMPPPDIETAHATEGPDMQPQPAEDTTP